MVQQSKNKVKLNKEYKVIGRIPMAAIKKIQEVMELPGNVQTIRANIGNTLKHNKKHLDEIEMHLTQLGLTKEDYVEFVTRKFNEIHSGNTPLSLLLAVANEEYPNHVAAVRLNYNKNENFWLVTTVHAIRPSWVKCISSSSRCFLLCFKVLPIFALIVWTFPGNAIAF